MPGPRRGYYPHPLRTPPPGRGPAVLNSGGHQPPPVKTKKHKGWDDGVAWTAEEVLWTAADNEQNRAVKASNHQCHPTTSDEISARYNPPAGPRLWLFLPARGGVGAPRFLGPPAPGPGGGSGGGWG